MKTTTTFEQQYVELIAKLYELLEAGGDRNFDQVLRALYEMTRLAMKSCDGVHLPELDKLLLKLSREIQCRYQSEQLSSEKSILLVSELYLNGGHSRIVEDIVELMEDNPFIIITDYIGNYAHGRLNLGEMYKRMENAAILTIPDGSHIEKVISLIQTINLIRPNKLYLALNHADSIGYVASQAHSIIDIKTIFIHHADHKPSLGTTIDYFKHLDTTQEYLLKCQSNKCKNCEVLPLYVKDQGRNVSHIESKEINFASIGARNKYVFNGKLDYSNRIITCLTSVDNSLYFHIGPLDKIALDKIHNSLLKNGVEISRFKHINHVRSVWLALQYYKIKIVIGSAPISGGRTAIEAQGAGVPVLWYNNGISSIYDRNNLFWCDDESLRKVIKQALKEYLQLSESARSFYLKNYTNEKFKKALDLLS